MPLLSEIIFQNNEERNEFVHSGGAGTRINLERASTRKNRPVLPLGKIGVKRVRKVLKLG